MYIHVEAKHLVAFLSPFSHKYILVGHCFLLFSPFIFYPKHFDLRNTEEFQQKVKTGFISWNVPGNYYYSATNFIWKVESILGETT